MANIYGEDTNIALQKFEHHMSVIEQDEQKVNTCFNQVHCNVCDNNDRLSKKQTNRTSIDLKEWRINDSRSGKPRAPRQNEFLLLLLSKQCYSSYISWLDKDQGLCQIHQPEEVATLWDKVKKRSTAGPMDYDTFARGIRLYYKSGLMVKTYRKHILRFRLPLNIISN